MKRDPDVRVEHVIEYGAPMREPGFYFMDSPGNDLESIAGPTRHDARLRWAAHITAIIPPYQARRVLIRPWSPMFWRPGQTTAAIVRNRKTRPSLPARIARVAA